MHNRTLLVVAHADDEIIGAGNRLAGMDHEERRGVVIAYLTDSAPENPWFTHEAGFATREEYAAARKHEREAALRIAGISPDQCRDFGFIDQQSWRHLVEITGRIADLIAQVRPAVILTHPYEGGHPDHDSAAFCVRQAVADMDSSMRPAILEFASYHAGPNGLETGRFLSRACCPEQVATLQESERRRKQAMFDCHRTQARVLAWFDVAEERFRPAPEYDFNQPPHAGVLHYESLNWGITGQMWREEAQQALRLLSQPCNIWD